MDFLLVRYQSSRGAWQICRAAMGDGKGTYSCGGELYQEKVDAVQGAKLAARVLGIDFYVQGGIE